MGTRVFGEDTQNPRVILSNINKGTVLISNDDIKSYRSGEEYTILDSGNYSSYALPLAGGQMTNGARIYPAIDALYIGKSDNNGWVYMADMCSQSGETYWKIYARGEAVFASTVTASDFITTSDNRLKDFVSDIDLDFEALKLIPKKYYYWKDKSMGEDLQIGTSAQELAKIYPTCVSYDEVSDRYSVNYQKLSIVALAAIDKLHERVLELEAKIND